VTVPAAYLGVIVIWTTTPLAIKWSGDGAHFLFGITGRMVLSLMVALLVVMVMRVPLPWHRQARYTYLAAGLGLYLAMLCVYWATQYIPSGWISVVFGLTPLMTGAMASYWLGEDVYKPFKVLGMMLGLAGLLVIFGSGYEMGPNALFGVIGILIGVCIHSASSVWVKRLNQGLDGMSVSAGGLLIAAPLFLLTWFLADSNWPVELTERAAYSILYLSLVGSVVGFALYFYVLKHLDATRVALITLVTPVTALLLGSQLNNEVVGMQVWFGTVLIMSGLVCFELSGHQRWAKLLNIKSDRSRNVS